MTTDRYELRLARLRELLSAPRRIAVAFSGGVDSTVLLHAAHAARGGDVVGVIADSPSLPRAELADARSAARAIGVRLIVLATDELEVEGYRRNAGDRCYWCRRTLFERMERWACAEGWDALAYGEITDDLADHRPGRRAAGEFGVLAPLAEAGFSKEDVRRYARSFGLSAAEKPASACLASRIPVGRPVTREALARVERAEAAVRGLGFRVLRVRDHGERARLEVGAGELARAELLRDRLAALLAADRFRELELAVYGAR